MRYLCLICAFFLLLSCKESAQQYNGYIDADLTYLSSEFAGRLTSLFVHRGQEVTLNQALFKLEQASEKFNIEISQLNRQNLLAQRKELLDQINYDESNYKRTTEMRKHHAASQNDLEVALKDLNVLKNKLNAIDFQIKSSEVNTADKEWQRQRKEGYAPESGIIFDTYYTKGEFVQAGQPLLSLVTKEKIKVIFFIPERDLSKINLNDTITLSADGNSQLGTGKINYISNIAQYTPPIIYSREDRQSLVFRVEAQINTPNLRQVHLGQPVSLEISK